MANKVLVCCVLAAALGRADGEDLTARAAIERIKAHVGVPWRSETVDTFKAGDPNTRVTGIATTMMATFEVLQKAAAAGKNLIITHEPTFYGHQDQTADLSKENDAVWADKDSFIRKHNLVIWRFHDHWHLRRPDGILAGMTRALGWEKYRSDVNPSRFTLPEMTVGRLASDIKNRLQSGTVRVVGDAGMTFTKVGLSPGAGGFAGHRRALQQNDVEVLVIGEVPEWETIEYVADARAQGKRKALILMGHISSEQAGMEDCSGWLKSFITEVPIGFVAASEFFWMPK